MYVKGEGGTCTPVRPKLKPVSSPTGAPQILECPPAVQALLAPPRNSGAHAVEPHQPRHSPASCAYASFNTGLFVAPPRCSATLYRCFSPCVGIPTAVVRASPLRLPSDATPY